MKACGAKTRNGTPCKKPPMKGVARCALHGGKSLKGPKHPNFTHGLYSKHVHSSLANILDELQGQDTEQMINPLQEIRLMQALIINAKALKSEISDIKNLEIISRIIDRLVFAKQRSQQILLEERKLIPVTDVERFLDFLDKTLERHIPDQAIQIMDEIKNFKIS